MRTRGRDPRPEQAVRLAAGRRRARHGRAPGRGLRLPRAQRLGQDDDDPDAARSRRAHRRRTRSLLGHAIPREATRALPRVGCAGRGAGLPPLPLRPVEPARLDAADLMARPAYRAARGSTPRSTGSGCWRPPASATAPTRSVCGSGWPSPPPCSRRASCSSSTSRRTALTPKELARCGTSSRRSPADGATVLISSHLLSEVEQICTHLGDHERRPARRAGHRLRAAWRPAVTTVRVLTDSPTVATRSPSSGSSASAASRRSRDEVRGPPGTASRPRRSSRRSSTPAYGVRGFAVTTPSLEDLFVGLTGEGFDVSG